MEIIRNLIESHIVRINDDKTEYLLLKRSSDQKYPNLWQMVTGKIQNNEKAYQTVVREIKEETGLEVKKLFIVPNVNSFYNAENDSINFVPVFLTIVDLSKNVVLSNEHQAYKWVNKKEAQNLLAWPGQSKSVKIIDDFLSKKKKNINFIEINV